MSFATISLSAQDQALTARVNAATIQEAWNNPMLSTSTFGRQVRETAGVAQRMVYPTVTASDVEAAYASALAAGNPDPGGDEAVITDGMILANVQTKWPEETTP